MHPVLDLSPMTPDERRHEVAAILARALRRLRDRTALAGFPVPENLLENEQNSLEPVPEKPLTDHAG